MDQFAMLEFRINVNRLLNWFLDVRSSGIDNEGEHRKYELARHIAQCYRILLAGVKDAKLKGMTKHTVEAECYDTEDFLAKDEDYRRRILTFVEFVRENLEQYVAMGLIHGSQADLHYSIGWSDIDTFLVLKDSVVTDPGKLVKLREIAFSAWPCFMEICWYQHHGFLFICEFETHIYPSCYMPKEAFKFSKLLVGNENMLSLNLLRISGSSKKSLESRLKTVNTSVREGVFKHHPYQGKYLYVDFSQRKDNMHQMFAYLNYLMLVPSLFLDAIGRPVYKGDSFRLVKDFLSEKSIECLSKASRIRRDWAKIEGLSKRDNSIPEWIIEMLGEDFIYDGKYLLEEVIGKINKYNAK